MESLKTGFVLMRSRPHDGAVTGGWDQLMIASPMVRMGDEEMMPRYLEHWLHQYQLDGQIFHVSDFDLSPAMLFRRWDLDDFMYLIIAAQWIAHAGDEEMLDRLAAKCTHMLRAYWFGWSATGWYEALLSGAAGIWEEPGGLAYIPADQHESVALSNLPYRGGTWDIRITGQGAWVSRFVVDGQA